MSRVAIVVPVHQTRPWVRRAVESALAQSQPDVEVVVVDDGSTDGAVEEILDFAAAGRLRLIRQPNRGVAAARNAGWRASSGVHLLFLDSDDEIDPRLIERLLDAAGAEAPNRLVYCDCTWIDADGEPLPGRERAVAQARRHREGDLLPALLFGGFFQIHCMLVPRGMLEATGGFDERFLWCEDYHLHLRLAALGAPARFLPEPLVRYRIRAGSKSADLARLREWTGRAIADAAGRAPRAFAAALPAALAELDWLCERVRADGAEHVARCAAEVDRLESLLRAFGPAPAPRPGARPSWAARRLTAPAPEPDGAWRAAVRAACAEPLRDPDAVATALVRLYQTGNAESAALWADAHARLARGERRARRLERALARLDARGVG